MLRVEESRERQRRLLRLMERDRLELAVLSSPSMVYYFTGALVDTKWPQAFLMAANGDSLLVTNREPKQSAAGALRLYTGYTVERIFGRRTMHDELAAAAREFAASHAGPAGVEAEAVTVRLDRDACNLTPVLEEMRRRKDPDELECIRATIAIVESGYAAIRRRLTPGMTEIDAYLVIYDAVVRQAGTSLELVGDFACGTRAIRGGGPPTARVVAPGDLYIIDLFPNFEGYNCDLCRTFCAGTPNGRQAAAWERVIRAHDIAAPLIRPGLPTREVFRALTEHLGPSHWHHGGHGIGLEGWEQPWINGGSDQVFVEGEVVACEPAMYGEELQGGIRLEHNYLVTKDGPVALDSFAMEL